MVALSLVPATLVGQETFVPPPGDTIGPPYEVRFERLPSLGGPLEERLRLRQRLGTAALDGFLLRSPSTLLQPATTEARVGIDVLLPELRVVHNSALPFSLNEGAMWAGRGLNLGVTGGVRLTSGRVTFVLAPQVTAAWNRDFQTLPYPQGQSPRRSPYAAPWYYPPESIDRPQRFGDGALRTISMGQSSLNVDLGPVAAGAATENLWWGPARMNALVMSANAPGIPHFFLRTARPVETKIGSFEARWIAGRLGGSGYFDLDGARARSISALAVVARPAFEPDLSLGFSRAVYARTGGQAGWVGHALDVLGGVGRPARDEAAGDPVGTADQILSLFGRWVFPESGLELYGEWGRTERPASLRDLLVAPHHTQGYTLGAEWSSFISDSLVVSLGAEVTNLELSSTHRSRPTLSWYTSPAVPEGYTHHGRVIGAAIGPGASSQWITGDIVGSRWKAGVYAGRIRWNNGVFYSRAYAPTYFGHDVSVHTGVRGAVNVGSFMIEGEFGSAGRYNYLFQHHPLSIDDVESVDIRNRTLRLGVLHAVPFL